MLVHDAAWRKMPSRFFVFFLDFFSVSFLSLFRERFRSAPRSWERKALFLEPLFPAFHLGIRPQGKALALFGWTRGRSCRHQEGNLDGGQEALKERCGPNDAKAPRRFGALRSALERFNPWPPMSRRQAWKDLHAKFFHKCSASSFNSNLGLSLEEVCYLDAKHGPRCGLSKLDIMIGLHFAWRCPKQEEGAALFKMSRPTCAERCWKAPMLMGVHGDEMKMENRHQDAVLMEGPAECVTLMTDSSDFLVPKPGSSRVEQKRHCTFKNRKFACRCAIAVSTQTGHLCWVSRGDPAGSVADLTMNRREGLAEKVRFFERIGADGACKCMRDPVHITPNRKPRGGELTEAEQQENTAFSRRRVTVENVFSRVKQWASMQKWRHRRENHPTMADFVFQLTQIKNLHRPIRAMADTPARRAAVQATWREAEEKGVPPRAGRGARREAKEAPGERARNSELVEQTMGMDLANEEWEALLMAQAAVDQRSVRAARRAARASNADVAAGHML